MSKHQEILIYLEKLPVGKRVSVRSISNHLRVSDGTAYRAIKEAENRGLVETRPRSGTVRVEKKTKERLDRLTYAEIARVSDSEVLAGHSGLGHEFSKFSIGAMTRDNILRYLVKGGLLIVGDREAIQLLALEHANAILVTGGFKVSDRVLDTSNKLGIPVMVTSYDTFTVATMINQALSNVRIKTDVKTVDQIYQFKNDYGCLLDTDHVSDYIMMLKHHNHVRFPVVDKHDTVLGVVSMRDLAGKDGDISIAEVMSKDPVVTTPNVSLATISQKMIFEDYDMLPVVNENHKLLGVVTRRRVMESLQDSKNANLHTYSEQIVSNLKLENDTYQFAVEPAMVDNSGNLAQGILAELIKEVVHRRLMSKNKKNIIIEQMVIYFLQSVQIDDVLAIVPNIITETRRSAAIDVEIHLNSHVVVKALVTSKMS
ncbi:CBS-HotDog domain-containing transcription factor SpxR [Streptococcus entericus]|uniref:CBS-HotDog domain-containing transcription factor SpxR n=1 Tax=Streptococcus entericus TaxID=155680 RepID=UPI000377B901|nr:CBS-HotDog domain-containing transcription factor SpxR [Streptococcus entericus]